MNKLLPPVLFVIAASLMLLTHYCLPGLKLAYLSYRWAGLPLVAAGLGISAWHKRLFHRVGTNIDTFGEPGRLVTDGMFRVSRNPMYLGFVLALLGLSVILSSLTPLIIALVFVVITDRWYIALEEKAMLKKFGEQYAAYKKCVRRWI